MTDHVPPRPSRRALAARRWLFAALGLVAFACNLNPRPDTNASAGDDGSKGNGGLPSAAGGAFGTGGAASAGGAYTGAGGAPGAVGQDAGAFPPSIGADAGDAGPSDAGEDAGD